MLCHVWLCHDIQYIYHSLYHSSTVTFLVLGKLSVMYIRRGNFYCQMQRLVFALNSYQNKEILLELLLIIPALIINIAFNYNIIHTCRSRLATLEEQLWGILLILKHWMAVC